MLQRPPTSTHTYTLFPYRPLSRSSSLHASGPNQIDAASATRIGHSQLATLGQRTGQSSFKYRSTWRRRRGLLRPGPLAGLSRALQIGGSPEEHTSELQSLMRLSSAVFWLK